MVRNIPTHYDQERLLSEFPPNGTFDYLYLPYCVKERRPKGFAFINFVTPEFARVFQHKWHGKYLTVTYCVKHLDIAASAAQGILDNLKPLCDKEETVLSLRTHLPAIFQGRRRLNTLDVIFGAGLPLKKQRGAGLSAGSSQAGLSSGSD